MILPQASSLFVLIPLVGALLVAAGLVPVVRALFRRFGIVDKPDRERKLHAGAVSLGGGLAVFMAVCLTVGAVAATTSSVISPASESTSPASQWATLADQAGAAPALASEQWRVLFGAAAFLMVVGLVDDAIALRGRQKLLLQILVVACVVGGGTVVQSIACLGHQIHLGVFAYPITAIWLLATINALNLIDGADGVASTAGAIISGALALVCAQNGDALGATVAAALSGSLLGFLLYNRPPATIYLGDAGSMVIGLLVGVLAIWGGVRGTTLWSFAPLSVLALPLFDSAIAILRRGLTGRGIFAADRGHLHHRLLDRFSHPVMLWVLAGLCSITAIAAVLSVHRSQQWIAAGGVLVALGLLVGSGCFGTAELRMLVSRGLHFVRSLFAWNRRYEAVTQQRSIQLQGDRCWDPIWLSLVQFACDRGLAQIKLDVGIAWMQEGYHASWRRVRMPAKVDQACLKLPIFIDGRFVGRLEAVGDAQHVETTRSLQLLIERCEGLGGEIEGLLQGGVAGAAPVGAEKDHCEPPRFGQEVREPAERPLAVAGSEC